MKRKRGGSATTDLRSFMQRVAAKKKSSEPEVVTPSTNESQMQIVVFQGQSTSGTSTISPEAVREEQQHPANPPIVEDDESMPIDESGSEDEDNGNYNIEHDSGLRAPISSYPINNQDSIIRAYIALGPCRPNMKRDAFPQHDCGGMRRFQPKRFDEFKWVEYSMHNDAPYCFFFFAICSRIVANILVEMILLMKDFEIEI
ncbi:zinc finger MYM-type protein 1-like [Panicum miliaceum]|uniref:Zinc finger MYM-type protein 1-like n=1 Tax=Panicum miliaceum TaxID=4540 RepID=A0A3L6RQ19_PANMI|nr:zinc finger MYM-type protein 1-like [Panicum miliaceum]